MEEPVRKLIEGIVFFIPRALTSLLIFLLFLLASTIAARIIGRICRKSNFRKDILILIQRITKIALLGFGAVTALGTAGIDISALVAGLGLTGFALGFAFRDILSNLLAGVLIIIFAPFHQHDHISVAGLEGTVIEIDLRYTTLEAENRKILIPNSTLFTNAIIVMGSQ
ncbi:MAG: mechanosensitive ion channel domain-containing protein [bacterium]